MSGFIKRFVLSMVASKLEKAMHRRGRSPVVDGLLRAVHHRLGHHHRPYGHSGAYGHGQYGYRGHYRHHGHYRRGFHGHYRRKRW